MNEIIDSENEQVNRFCKLLNRMIGSLQRLVTNHKPTLGWRILLYRQWSVRTAESKPQDFTGVAKQRTDSLYLMGVAKSSMPIVIFRQWWINFTIRRGNKLTFTMRHYRVSRFRYRGFPRFGRGNGQVLRLKCNSQDLLWHLVHYRIKKLSDVCCEIKQLSSLTQPDDILSVSFCCIISSFVNWYLLATAIPSIKVCRGVFPKQYFPEWVLSVLYEFIHVSGSVCNCSMEV